MARQDILDQITQSFGFVPGLMDQMPDAVLEQYWTTLSWVLGETKLPARDKALVAFGAASAIHCAYWIPFHTAQLALGGLNDEQIKEAAWTVQSVSGASAYAHGVAYDFDVWREELDRAVAHVKAQMQQQ